MHERGDVRELFFQRVEGIDRPQKCLKKKIRPDWKTVKLTEDMA